MFEFHGWATIRESATEIDDGRLSTIVADIKSYFIGLRWDTGVLDIRPTNGEYHVWLAGLTNHRPNAEQNPIEILRTVGQIAPGSYGILYVWDDECKGLENVFQVFVLIRGQVQARMDPFLSPCSPVLEDSSSS